jgi:hypothetical protein
MTIAGDESDDSTTVAIDDSEPEKKSDLIAQVDLALCVI